MPLAMMMTKIWVIMAFASLICFALSKRKSFCAIALSALSCAVMDIVNVGHWEQVLMFFGIFLAGLPVISLLFLKKK